MATTRDDIRAWWDRGQAEGATHLIVVCDTFEHEDYPVFVHVGEDPRAVYSRYHGSNMQRVMEVYRLDQDRERQIAERRAFNF